MAQLLARLKYSIQGYRSLIGVLLLILAIWGGSFVTFATNVNQSIQTNEADARAKEREVSRLLEEFESTRQAELQEKAKQEAEKTKAAKEAAAKKAAEEAATKKPAPTSGNASAACNAAGTHNNPTSIDVVVNKKHCLVPLTFVPPDLVSVSGGATLSAKAAAPFKNMFAAATAAGQPFTVSSSYRSYQTQITTYNYWVSVNGQAVADTVSARPGYSEHQTGFVVDVGAGSCTLNCFGGTSQYKWFQANAAEYGFIQRYYAGFEHVTGYAGEEWHYRYVGVAVAKDMKARGIKTLEQYWGVEGGGYR